MINVLGYSTINGLVSKCDQSGLDHITMAGRPVAGIQPNPWFALHSHNPLTWSDQAASELLKSAIASVSSCGGCKKHAIDYVAANKPDFSTREKYHEYVWTFHNAVTARVYPLRKLFTWDEYKQYWLKWKSVDGPRIGFITSCFEPFGGTETFHETIVRRFPGVVGFASQLEIKRDTSILGVPTGWGNEAIESLVLNCDVVFAWNIDWSHRRRPKRLISIHHGSFEDTDGIRLAKQGDTIVCVNNEVADYVREETGKPVHWIPNAVDPDRIKPRNAVETNGKKICLWAHRFSSDKRPQLAAEIAKLLPDDWHMVLTGHLGEPIEINDRVTVLGNQHPGDWLAVASCFLSTSLFDGFGLSMAEAIVAGVPVVATPVGIASRPGLAVTVPIDASPEHWAAAIVGSGDHVLPSRELFSLDAFMASWEALTAQRKP